MTHFPLNTESSVLKGLLPEYLERIGHQPRLDPGGLKLKARCPLHPDQNPSLTARKMGDVWEWYCHPCQVGGAVIELHAKRFDLNPKTQFSRICREVAEIIRIAPAKHPITAQRIEPPTKMNSPPIPRDKLVALTWPWRQTLYLDGALRHKFASELGLPDHILLWAALRAHDSLGIAPAGYAWTSADGRECCLREARLVYIGLSHYKIRSPFGDGRDPRFLMFGQTERPWLGELLAPGNTTVRDVHLHESETSTLALISAGYWTPDQNSIVVATSGSCGFKPEWVPLFAGRTIHLWPDAGEPGKRFAENAAQLLYGVASKLLFHDWNPTTTEP